MKVRDGPDKGGKTLAGGEVGGGTTESGLVPVGEVGVELPHAVTNTRSATTAPRPTVVLLVQPSPSRPRRL